MNCNDAGKVSNFLANVGLHFWHRSKVTKVYKPDDVSSIHLSCAKEKVSLSCHGGCGHTFVVDIVSPLLLRQRTFDDQPRCCWVRSLWRSRTRSERSISLTAFRQSSWDRMQSCWGLCLLFRPRLVLVGCQRIVFDLWLRRLQGKDVKKGMKGVLSTKGNKPQTNGICFLDSIQQWRVNPGENFPDISLRKK